MIRAELRVCGCAIAIALTSGLSRTVDAETIHCDSGDVPCLIAAIHEANDDATHKTTIRLAGGSYVLTSVDNVTNGRNGLPSIASQVTISGGRDGATISRASNAPNFRIMHVAASGDLTLDGITLSGGRSTFVSGETNDLRGGALFNAGGTVTFVDSSVENNDSGSGGSGVFNDQGTIAAFDSVFSRNFTSLGQGAGLLSTGGVITFEGVTIERNLARLGGGLAIRGGEAHITQSHFMLNSSDREGGGFHVFGGTASITQTTFARNGAEAGGAIVGGTGTNVTIRDSAFVQNFAAFVGGALLGNADITNSTFARNVVGLFQNGSGAAVAGGGTFINTTFVDNGASNRGSSPLRVSVISGGAATRLLNTIVVDTTGDPFLDHCRGPITSLGNNLIGDPFGCGIILQSSDLTGLANLGPFTDDGTPGNAHYPLGSHSPAIDAANDQACPKKDQLGRPRQPRCDIGAVEFRRPDGKPGR